MTEAEKLRDDLITWRTDMGTAEFTAALDALLAAVRAEERETLATGLDTRLVPRTPYIVCARIELLAELAAALREGA